MTIEEIRELYATNADFKAYVKGFCRTKRYTVDQVLGLKIVEEVAKVYKGIR